MTNNIKHWIKKIDPTHWNKKSVILYSVVFNIVFTIVFSLLLPRFGPSFTSISMFPVAFSAWFLGMKAGLVNSLLFTVYVILIMEITGTVPFDQMFTGSGLIGFITLYFSAVVLGYVGSLTRRTREEIKLREQLFQIVPSAVYTVDRNQNITSINEKALQILGYRHEELIGRKCTSFALEPCVGACGLFDDAHRAPISGVECKVRTKKGSTLIVQKNADLIIDSNGEIIGGIESFEDITESKLAEETLQYLATHDNLTGLSNRSHFEEFLTRAIALAGRSGKKLGVLFLDLDGFKDVNDTYGHETGDLLLAKIAEILNFSIRESDLAGRMGGDEFAVLLQEIDDRRSAVLIVKRILAKINNPIMVDGMEIRIGTSIGISVFPNDAADAGTLLRFADIAMYEVKRKQKGSYLFYKDYLTMQDTRIRDQKR